MAQSSVDVHPEAIEEARAAYRWYRERNRTAAEAFLVELDRAVELISEGPMRWPTYLHGTRHFLLRRFPFIVVYRQIGAAVQVVAVAHALPASWLLEGPLSCSAEGHNTPFLQNLFPLRHIHRVDQAGRLFFEHSHLDALSEPSFLRLQRRGVGPGKVGAQQENLGARPRGG